MKLSPDIPDARQAESSALAEYQQTRSPQALEALVRRHADLVYGAAVRQLRDAAAAQDVMQVVFTVLALKAPKLRPDTLLGPWLLRVARYTALDHSRRVQRRARFERRGQQLRQQEREARMTTHADGLPVPPRESDHAEAGIEWQEMRAMLDEGIAGLSRSDRAAVVLRYFEGKSYPDIAAALGIREEAARKRLQRGVENLRGFFARRGVIGRSTTASAVASALTVHGRVPPPPELVSALVQNVSRAVSGGASAAGAAGTLVSSAKGVITLMAWTKIKLAGIAVLCLLLLTGGGAVAVHALGARPRDEAIPVPVRGTVPQPNGVPVASAAQDYVLAPGEVLKRISKPDPAARERISSFLRGRNPSSVTVAWTGKPQLESQTYGGAGQSLEGILTYVIGLSSFDFSAPREVLNREVIGDWIVRQAATPEERIAALQPILASQPGTPLQFQKRSVRREIVTARGSFEFQPVDNPDWSKQVNVYADALNRPRIGGGGTGGLDKFLNSLGDIIHCRVANKADRSRAQFSWTYHDSGDLRYMPPGDAYSRRLDQVLSNVSRQTGLTFQRSYADEQVWVISPAP